jgi:hypothetical protein
MLHKPSEVEVEGLVTLWGASLRSAQPQLLEGPGDRVEASGGGVWGVGALASSPSVVTMKSRLPKRTCAPGVQSMSWLAIRSLMKVMKRAKAPTWRVNCRCSESPASKFCGLRVWDRMAVQRGHKDVYWFGGMSLRPVASCCSCYLF